MEQTLKSVDVKALAVAEFNESDIKLQEFKEKYDDVVYDLTDEDQEKQARSDRLTIGKVVSSLDTKHKELKAPLKAKTDLIDGERKRIKDDLLGVQDKIKSQIAAHEKKIADHAEMLHNKVEAIRALAVFDGYVRPTAEQIAERFEQAKAINVDESFEHRQADGTFAQVQVTKELETLFASQVKHEKEQAELELLRKEAADREQANREEQIRKDAVQEATIAAERAAQEEVDAAKRKQLEAEQLAETAAQTERNRIENERLDALEKARQVQAAEDAKKAKQSHRAKIHGEAKQSLMDGGFDATEAGVIISLIKDGKIKNVRIEY